jgi:NADPH:quinone reductase-like Zn-dependent oxidoreductase
MSTISVTSGAFPRSKSLRKRRSTADVSNLGQSESARSSRLSIDTMPEELVEELQRTTMSMTAHTPPPRKLTSTHVLVQIMTCAIDETDRQLLREEIKRMKAYGFIPGRSFCGRVMETGWEVKRVRKGDVVFGLQSSRKCGALAEFMTIDQNLIAKAPEDCLTTEEIAALPAVGVMAYQMMTNHCSQLMRGSRVLILNAHDGVGFLTMQEAANLGLIIVAQCPDSISDGVALCEANGANEVVIGDPLWALNSLHESSFDLVLDTIGGRRVYDAAKRVLAF